MELSPAAAAEEAEEEEERRSIAAVAMCADAKSLREQDEAGGDDGAEGRERENGSQGRWAPLS